MIRRIRYAVVFASTAQHRGVAVRVILSLILFPAAHIFAWKSLRAFLTAAVFFSCLRLNLPVRRIAFDTFELRTWYFQFSVGCTLVDFFFAASPFLWRTTRRTWANLLFLGACFGCLCVFNLVRQVVGFAAFAHGAPWFWAHEFPAGIIDFSILLVAVRLRAWATATPPLVNLGAARGATA